MNDVFNNVKALSCKKLLLFREMDKSMISRKVQINYSDIDIIILLYTALYFFTDYD